MAKARRRTFEMPFFSCMGPMEKRRRCSRGLKERSPVVRESAASVSEPPHAALQRRLKSLFGQRRIAQRKPDGAGQLLAFATILHPFLLRAGVEGTDLFPHMRRPVDVPPFRRATPAFLPERRAFRAIQTASVHGSSLPRPPVLVEVPAKKGGPFCPPSIMGRSGGHPRRRRERRSRKDRAARRGCGKGRPLRL